MFGNVPVKIITIHSILYLDQCRWNSVRNRCNWERERIKRKKRRRITFLLKKNKACDLLLLPLISKIERLCAGHSRTAI